jgi:uncharacterized protein DUF2865
MTRKSPLLGLASALVLAGVAVVALPHQAAAESGLFGDIFHWLSGSRDDRFAPATAYTDPAATPERRPLVPAVPSVSGGTYCVRLCDGRYFPLSSAAASSRAGAAKVCSAMCPASKTAIFRGGDIDTAYGAGGERYADIGNAFVYRDRLVADCTCNGRDAFGLAPVDIATDTTLRPGDIVATSAGLTVFKGSRGETHKAAEFSPIRNAPYVSADTRRKLADTLVSRGD